MTMTPSQPQQTIGRPAMIEGRGLFGGQKSSVQFKPAPADHGVVFWRTDVGPRPVRIPALISHVVSQARRTTIHTGEVSIETCEHCLSAVAGLSIDNLDIEVSGPELPGADGSALPYAQALMDATLVQQSQPRQVLQITTPVSVSDGPAMIAALPSTDPSMQVIYDLDYGDRAPLGHQIFAFNCSSGDYLHNLAPARTFVLEEEARQLRAHGMGMHLTPDEILVLGPRGPLGGNQFRFQDEPARHKLLDMLGDLSLAGRPIQARIVAHRSGHSLNHAMARALAALV